MEALVKKGYEPVLTSVLCVEDDEQVVEIMREFFGREFDLVTVSNPEEGIEIARSRSFDLIISDYQMDNMNGIELLKRLRRILSKTTPFILFTGKVSEEIVNEVTDREYFYYVSKGVGAFEKLLYIAKDAAVRKRAIDFPINVVKVLQILNSTTLHDWKNYDMSGKMYCEMIEEETDIKKIKEYSKKIAISFKKNQKLREESKVFHEVNDENGWYLLKDILPQKSEDYPKLVFVNEIPEDIEIFASMKIFSRVMEILVDNSMRHGQRVSEVRFSLIKGDKDARFIYKDNGVGIVPENKKYIFNRGFGNNTGLGLFLAKESMYLSGGDIVETGTVGQGACFEIKVPFCLYRHTLKKE